MSVSRPVVFAKINLQQAVFKQDRHLFALPEITSRWWSWIIF